MYEKWIDFYAQGRLKKCSVFAVLLAPDIANQLWLTKPLPVWNVYIPVAVISGTLSKERSPPESVAILTSEILEF